MAFSNILRVPDASPQFLLTPTLPALSICHGCNRGKNVWDIPLLSGPIAVDLAQKPPLKAHTHQGKPTTIFLLNGHKLSSVHIDEVGSQTTPEKLHFAVDNR